MRLGVLFFFFFFFFFFFVFKREKRLRHLRVAGCGQRAAADLERSGTIWEQVSETRPSIRPSLHNMAVEVRR